MKGGAAVERYARNRGAFPDGGQAALAAGTVAVVGLGGLGGHVCELLARAGVGALVLVDRDAVSESNLNRQLFATEQTVGMSKVRAAALRLAQVNSGVRLMQREAWLDRENGEALLAGADVVVDALDNREGRVALAACCRALGVPMVHGAVNGWMGQVCFVRAEDDGVRKVLRLSPQDDAAGAVAWDGEASPRGGAGDHRSPLQSDEGDAPRPPVPAPPFAPAMVASVQAAQAARYLMGMDGLLIGQLLMMDMGANQFRTIYIAD